jgi:hypothetical protein
MGVQVVRVPAHIYSSHSASPSTFPDPLKLPSYSTCHIVSPAVSADSLIGGPHLATLPSLYPKSKSRSRASYGQSIGVLRFATCDLLAARPTCHGALLSPHIRTTAWH